MHEFDTESSAEGDHLDWSLAGLWEGGIEEAETETILKIANCINKRRVSKQRKNFQSRFRQQIGITINFFYVSN